MTRDHRVRHALSTIGLGLLLGLAGCAGTPEQPAPAQESPPEEQAEDTAPDRAAQAYPPSPHADLHARMEEQLLDGNWLQARQAISGLPAELPANEQAWRDYYLGWTHWLQGDDGTASELLDTAAAHALDPALQRRIGNLARHIASLRGDHLRAARLGLRLQDTTRDPDLQAALTRGMWRDLLLAPASGREAALEHAEGSWRGWLELAALDRPDRSGGELRELLQQWLETHPEHPAAGALPGGLGFLAGAREPRRQVALLLPLSGELSAAARAIRDGFLAQHYLSRPRDRQAQSLRFIDTGDFPDVADAYRQAVAGGAELVIGPLDRGAVDRLATLPQRTVPVIALNRSSEPAVQDGAAFLQLSLAPEDEMRQLAAQAFGSGARRALLVRPAGERGNRLAESLSAEWRKLGGQVADNLTYSSPEAWSEGLKSVLHLQASEQRAREIRAMLATGIEHTPRRRADLDAIFLLADTPAEARSLRPLLAFHYAGALPVYAPSTVYAGNPAPEDRDLDQVRIAEQPWLLGANPRARVAISAGNTGSDHYPRLNALGADAWLLQSRLEQLQAGPDALLRGNTGLLSLDPQLRVERQPRAAAFDGGELKPR